VHDVASVVRFDGGVRTSRAERLIAPAILVAIAATFVAAAGCWPWWTTGLLVVWAGLELALTRHGAALARVFARAGGGRPMRTAVQGVAVVLLAARIGASRSLLISAAVVVVAVSGLDVLAGVLTRYLDAVRRPPLVTRGLELVGLTPPRPLPTLIARLDGTSCVAVAIVSLGFALDRQGSHATTVGVVCQVAAVAFAALPAAFLLRRAVQSFRAKTRDRAAQAAHAAVERYAPEVVLYFAATTPELYQVRMWLEPMSRLNRRVAVVLRSYEVMDALGDIAIPTICTPYNGTIAALALPDPVVALFVTHSGNNLPMLRRPEARTVFVGHGDSDKADSVNPYARVYDQVWVAGPLGRRRYDAAEVGVADRAIVEIGRPQVRPPQLNPPLRTTIVYAPTWEGWGDDPHHSSLATIGPALVDALLARDVEVRYRPHPLTGRRNKEVRIASQQIIDKVGRVPPGETLTETFESASALIGDVSSVISEFLAFDRPYAVPDTRGLGRDAFHARFPSTAGGMVIEADLEGIDALVVAAADGPDSTRTARRELLADALGDPSTSQARFADAVTLLLAQ
jgi:CDP-Glycerol:Poly(glycerophosphate) glycerophosphotransferase